MDAKQKGSLPLKMTNKDIYFNVWSPFVEFILYRDEKTPTHQKPCSLQSVHF